MKAGYRSGVEARAAAVKLGFDVYQMADLGAWMAESTDESYILEDLSYSTAVGPLALFMWALLCDD